MASNGSRGLWLANEEKRAKLEDVKRDIQALNDIHALLDGTEWSNETLEQIAEILRESGREVREPDYGLHK